MSVGTDTHSFDRLILWVDEWLEDHPDLQDRCLVQHGSSPASRHARNVRFLSPEAMGEAMDQATIVVTHAGPASLFEARSHGSKPVCVPRDPARHEHVDDHQIRYSAHLATQDLIWRVREQGEFSALLDTLLVHPELAGLERSASDVADAVSRFGDIVERTVRRAPERGRRRRAGAGGRTQ